MENTVNERIVEVQKELKMSNQAFCNRVKISTGTLQNIKTGENINSKTLESIIVSLNLNEEWVMNGTGEMFINRPSITSSNDNPWKDALVSELKEEVRYLRELLKMAMSSKQTANFNNGIALAGLFDNKKFSNTVRA
jgi:fructose-1-phosphate kinase PfkB-like protein